MSKKSDKITQFERRVNDVLNPKYLSKDDYQQNLVINSYLIDLVISFFCFSDKTIQPKSDLRYKFLRSLYQYNLKFAKHL